jgi:hypothetical protein
MSHVEKSAKSKTRDEIVAILLESIQRTGSTWFNHKVIGSPPSQSDNWPRQLLPSSTSLIIWDTFGEYVYTFDSLYWEEDLYSVFRRHADEAELQWNLKNGILPNFFIDCTINELRKVLPKHDFWILNNAPDDYEVKIAYNSVFDELTVSVEGGGQLSEYQAFEQARELIANRTNFKKLFVLRFVCY